MKTISSLIVLASLALSLGLEHQTWGEYVDPAGSILLLGFLAYTAYGVVSMSVYDLLDRTLEESLQLAILRELAAHFHRYDNVHGIRSRRSESNVYIEIFLEFDSEQKMGDVQRVINEMKASLEEKIPGSQVVIAPTTSPVAA
ncbi:MAG: hypothetical protein HQ578_05395 [Chloroflexi bacterium]|nr:hypothetical protein [Chloroflexota bacterium]